MGYTAWAAGGFSATDYNLTMTPMGTAGNFRDQETVRQCVVGTRNGLNSSALVTTSMDSGMSSATTPMTPESPASSGNGQVLTAGSGSFRAGGTFGVLGLAMTLLVL